MAQFLFNIDLAKNIIPDTEEFNGWLVQHDSKTTTIHFRIPRYFDGGDVDLSALTFFVNCSAMSGKVAPQQETKNKSYDDDYVEFDWEIKNTLTRYAGSFAFLVCAYTEHGAEAWHSHKYTFAEVEKGIEPIEMDDYPPSENASVKEQIKALQDKLATMTGADPETIKQAVNEYLTENPISGAGLTEAQAQALAQHTTALTGITMTPLTDGTTIVNGSDTRLATSKAMADYVKKQVGAVSEEVTGVKESLSQLETKVDNLPTGGGTVTDEHINGLIDAKLNPIEALADDVLEVI